MKPIFQTNHRYRLLRLAARTSHMSRKIEHNYQAAALDDVDGGCAGDCKPPFHAISQDYFAREAQRHFASETVVFCLLAMTTVLPLVNAASGVARLILSSGGPL
jgi:hypothetical protein